MDFYVWFSYFNDSLNLTETFEVVNSIEFAKVGQSYEKYGSLVYRSFRCNAKLKKEWDISSFPFDKQAIEILIEDIAYNKSRLVFVPDTIGSEMCDSLRLEGWKIKDFGVKVVDYTHETNYGEPSVPIGQYSTYSRFVVYFTLEREGWGLFFKLFTALFISVLISLLTFFFDPTHSQRFGLSVGAIFAAVGSQYVIRSSLPLSQSLTLVDILHDISFIYIFLSILISAVSLRCMITNRAKLSRKLNKIGFFVWITSYVILVAYFVIKSL